LVYIWEAAASLEQRAFGIPYQLFTGSVLFATLTFGKLMLRSFPAKDIELSVKRLA
jgi:hypothetical protein